LAKLAFSSATSHPTLKAGTSLSALQASPLADCGPWTAGTRHRLHGPATCRQIVGRSLRDAPEIRAVGKRLGDVGVFVRDKSSYAEGWDESQQSTGCASA
jgi:hypothetical protein